MEETISMLSKSLGSFCNHLQTSVDALKQSIDRRPIPLDSASSTFIQSLNRRVSSCSNDLNMLDSMSFGTVSFEELLGHCNEVFKMNQNALIELEDRLRSFGYDPVVDIEEKDEVSDASTPLEMDKLSSYAPRVFAASSTMNSLEEDLLLDESLSLKNLGISDVSLATLASEANSKTNESDLCSRQPMKSFESKTDSVERSSQSATATEEDLVKPVEAPTSMVKVSKEDYESLPSYLKALASREDLLDAVDKINTSLCKKGSATGASHFFQDEISSMSLGPKARSYLLLLVRMKKLVVETVDGLIAYGLL
ncbi:hypothetical protein CDL15_Pgr002197 [Punica granatum]|nr:hypothetical protein CDL15_Pgr002197 [Punica granatum]